MKKIIISFSFIFGLAPSAYAVMGVTNTFNRVQMSKPVQKMKQVATKVNPFGRKKAPASAEMTKKVKAQEEFRPRKKAQFDNTEYTVPKQKAEEYYKAPALPSREGRPALPQRNSVGQIAPNVPSREGRSTLPQRNSSGQLAPAVPPRDDLGE